MYLASSHQDYPIYEDLSCAEDGVKNSSVLFITHQNQCTPSEKRPHIWIKREHVYKIWDFLCLEIRLLGCFSYFYIMNWEKPFFSYSKWHLKFMTWDHTCSQFLLWKINKSVRTLPHTVDKDDQLNSQIFDFSSRKSFCQPHSYLSEPMLPFLGRKTSGIPEEGGSNG